MMNRTVMASAMMASLLSLAAMAAAVEATELEVKSAGDVRYVSGGAGDEEQQAMKAAAKDFNLEVTTAVSAGNYLSGVDVTIVKAGSDIPVLKTTTDGPILLAKLPKGRYEIRATANGKTQSKTVDVGDSGRASATVHLGQLEKPDPAVH